MIRSPDQVLHQRQDQTRLPTVLSPPSNRGIWCPSDPIRRPMCAHGAGPPRAVEGLFSTANEPQRVHLPRAAVKTARTSFAVILVRGLPDISRCPLALAAFWAHHRRRSASVVLTRKSSQEVYTGGGGGPGSAGGGPVGAGFTLARILAAALGSKPARAVSSSAEVGPRRPDRPGSWSIIADRPARTLARRWPRWC